MYALRIVSMAKGLRFTHTLIIIKWVHSISLVAVRNPVTSTVLAWFQCKWQNCTELSSGVFASTAADLDLLVVVVERYAMHPERMAAFAPPTDGLINNKIR